MALEKVVLVKKETSLEGLLKRHATTSQVKFYLESRGENYNFYLSAHNDYHQGLARTQAAIFTSLRRQLIDKKELDTFQFGNKDLVVVVGDPGLFVNVAKYVGGQPVICVNPDEARYDGTFASCNPDCFSSLLRKTLDEKAGFKYLTMAEARLQDGQVLCALNDLFIGQKTQVSARYALNYQGKTERQSSSGIIVSTGAGSSGWLTSVMIGAYAIATGKQCPRDRIVFPHDADYLRFAVREPFPTKITETTIVYGEITAKQPLVITSNMYDSGVIFSDGIESDYLEFNAGIVATVVPSEKKIKLVKSRL